MKKFFYYLMVIIIALGITGTISYIAFYNNRIENVISKDIIRMDSINANNIFWESRVILDKPFNESESFKAKTITNVFQTNVEVPNGIKTTVYFFIHDLETGKDSLDIHENAWISDDVELKMDEIKIDFKEAFNYAKKSNFNKSTSDAITLRHGFGRYQCNPFYTIGNDDDGHLWVDAITGEVMDKDPASIKK